MGGLITKLRQCDKPNRDCFYEWLLEPLVRPIVNWF